MSAIRLHDLTLGYDRHPAVHHLEGVIETGELVAIVGPNGAGKSTLLKGIAGALKPFSGRIELPSGQRVAYLPQSAEIDRSFPMSVYDLVAMGLWDRVGLFGWVRDRARIEAALSAVGLTGFERRPIETLSGGQMQRTLFARLLLQDARLILLDEPFTAIDSRTSSDLLQLVQRWHGEQRTVVAVLHDIEIVRRAFPRTLLLARETVAWGDTADVLKADNLAKAKRMIEAFDQHATVCERDAA
jgi:zinc/manganese transport system ATP-binding protein